MRTIIFFICIFCIACSHSEPKTPTPVVVQKEYNKYICGDGIHRPCDDFDLIGEKMAAGSRWIYNEATNTYKWVTSDANKKRATDALDDAGKAMKKLYEKVEDK